MLIEKQETFLLPKAARRSPPRRYKKTAKRKFLGGSLRWSKIIGQVIYRRLPGTVYPVEDSGPGKNLPLIEVFLILYVRSDQLPQLLSWLLRLSDHLDQLTRCSAVKQIQPQLVFDPPRAYGSGWGTGSVEPDSLTFSGSS